MSRGAIPGLCLSCHLHVPPPQIQTGAGPLDFPGFLEDLARWDPNREPAEARAEPMRTLMRSCRRPPVRNEIAAGSRVDQAVNAVWAAMVYHTPALHQALKTHGKHSDDKRRPVIVMVTPPTPSQF